jgi:DNA replication and repair protein RecF
VLSPGDIKLTTGTPGDRRRNFDILISQISRIYFDDLRSFNRIIKQKNSLLKDNLQFRRYSQGELNELMDSWNEKILLYGVKIIKRRAGFVHGFGEYMKMNFKDLVGDSYTPLLEYESELIEGPGLDNIDESSLRNKFEQVLNEKSGLEIKRGVTLVGPQRDDYVFRMRKNGNLFDMKVFASQGEHKTFLIALKLSEYIYLNDKMEWSNSGEPVLLLDDLFSELDRNRANNISALLPNFNQVFLTTTEGSYLEYVKKYFKREEITVIKIVNGTSEVIA